MDGEQDLLVGGGTPSRESLGTSIEVQTGNSIEVFSTREEIMAVHHRLQQKARTAALKLKVRQFIILRFRWLFSISSHSIVERLRERVELELEHRIYIRSFVQLESLK